jgi:hypothetical protein
VTDPRLEKLISLAWDDRSTSAIDIQDNPASFSASPIELQRMDLSRLSKDLLLASDTALLCSDWMMRPQMRVLYTYLVRVSRS